MPDCPTQSEPWTNSSCLNSAFVTPSASRSLCRDAFSGFPSMYDSFRSPILPGSSCRLFPTEHPRSHQVCVDPSKQRSCPFLRVDDSGGDDDKQKAPAALLPSLSTGCPFEARGFTQTTSSGDAIPCREVRSEFRASSRSYTDREPSRQATNSHLPSGDNSRETIPAPRTIGGRTSLAELRQKTCSSDLQTTAKIPLDKTRRVRPLLNSRSQTGFPNFTPRRVTAFSDRSNAVAEDSVLRGFCCRGCSLGVVRAPALFAFTHTSHSPEGSAASPLMPSLEASGSVGRLEPSIPARTIAFAENRAGSAS
mmetsp:Transcript_53542/g.117227  ORF Transcript_53542/g.117227 Transcript_53542/m.117227 type:complete len:308 (-) Transcript_53542:302-1225(-)